MPVIPPTMGGAYPAFDQQNMTMTPPPVNPYGNVGDSGPSFSLPEQPSNVPQQDMSIGTGHNMDDLEARLAALKKF